MSPSAESARERLEKVLKEESLQNEKANKKIKESEELEKRIEKFTAKVASQSKSQTEELANNNPRTPSAQDPLSSEKHVQSVASLTKDSVIKEIEDDENSRKHQNLANAAFASNFKKTLRASRNAAMNDIQDTGANESEKESIGGAEKIGDSKNILNTLRDEIINDLVKDSELKKTISKAENLEINQNRHAETPIVDQRKTDINDKTNLRKEFTSSAEKKSAHYSKPEGTTTGDKSKIELESGVYQKVDEQNKKENTGLMYKEKLDIARDISKEIHLDNQKNIRNTKETQPSATDIAEKANHANLVAEKSISKEKDNQEKRLERVSSELGIDKKIIKNIEGNKEIKSVTRELHQAVENEKAKISPHKTAVEKMQNLSKNEGSALSR